MHKQGLASNNQERVDMPNNPTNQPIKICKDNFSLTLVLLDFF